MTALDARVAEKVMGWTQIDRLHYTDAAGNWMVDGREFSPSTNIVDAWLVVEMMREHGADMDMTVYAVPGGHCHVSFENGHASAPTAPLAICEAALALLKQARPYVLGATQLYKVEGARQQARALLAQLPEANHG